MNCLVMLLPSGDGFGDGESYVGAGFGGGYGAPRFHNLASGNGFGVPNGGDDSGGGPGAGDYGQDHFLCGSGPADNGLALFGQILVIATRDRE